VSYVYWHIRSKVFKNKNPSLGGALQGVGEITFLSVVNGRLLFSGFGLLSLGFSDQKRTFIG